jgi:hypothetical protein
LVVFFFFFLSLDPPDAAPAPMAPRQHKKSAIKSNHCQICMLEPEDPEALEPELPDDCPGIEESLTLEPVLSEPDDDINEPHEFDEPEDESHAVHVDVVVAGAAVAFEAAVVSAAVVAAAVVIETTLACSCG